MVKKKKKNLVPFKNCKKANVFVVDWKEASLQWEVERMEGEKKTRVTADNRNYGASCSELADIWT